MRVFSVLLVVHVSPELLGHACMHVVWVRSLCGCKVSRASKTNKADLAMAAGDALAVTQALVTLSVACPSWALSQREKFKFRLGMCQVCTVQISGPKAPDPVSIQFGSSLGPVSVHFWG